MIRRLYVNNFRCLGNFELKLAKMPSALLIGKNGSGKSTVALALEVLQKIGRGTIRVDELVTPKDIARGNIDVPVRFEIEVDLKSNRYAYAIAFELPKASKELHVLQEKLAVDGLDIYTRERSLVSHLLPNGEVQGKIDIGTHLVNLPLVLPANPLLAFQRWLARMLILRPMPGLIAGDSRDETLEPSTQVTNFGSWFSGILSYTPAAYAKMDRYLKQLIPDLHDIQNEPMGKDAKSLFVRFSNELGMLSVAFEDLSDGEKCFMICALVLAANEAYGPLLCFWDEPDNYLALDEVQHFIMDLRRAFQSGGQFIATSHNPEAISCFSRENTLYLYRKSHLEPTIVRPVSELHAGGDLVGALARGDVEP